MRFPRPAWSTVAALGVVITLFVLQGQAEQNRGAELVLAVARVIGTVGLIGAAGDLLWTGWRRWRQRVPYSGDCPACRHDWREHPPVRAGEVCGECTYEFEHRQRVNDLPVCRDRAPTPPAARTRRAVT